MLKQILMVDVPVTSTQGTFEGAFTLHPNTNLSFCDFPNPKESSTMTSASNMEEPIESSLKERRML
ncbi:hypothetical protein TIFTF001_029797 [Ficus carica]|uniref:Uncharacterized protein n=1 Tax=Ficus carica TaxID=3494 RepID=A0AA88DS67_FICCA|nr:hypothetical protein TIFTF001_029797 [Ficus carica]